LEVRVVELLDVHVFELLLIVLVNEEIDYRILQLCAQGVKELVDESGDIGPSLVAHLVVMLILSCDLL
jgi:hypothetical protein